MNPLHLQHIRTNTTAMTRLQFAVETMLTDPVCDARAVS